MASAVLFVELAAGRLRKLERMAWQFAQGSVENRHHENLRCESAYGFGFKRLPHKMARFRQVNKEQREAKTQLKYRRTLPRCNG